MSLFVTSVEFHISIRFKQLKLALLNCLKLSSLANFVFFYLLAAFFGGIDPSRGQIICQKSVSKENSIFHIPQKRAAPDSLGLSQNFFIVACVDFQLANSFKSFFLAGYFAPFFDSKRHTPEL